MHEKEEDDELSHEFFSFPPSISWKLDFSNCGLAVKSVKIKAKTLGYGIDDSVSFEVMGENGSVVDDHIHLGGGRLAKGAVLVCGLCVFVSICHRVMSEV